MRCSMWRRDVNFWVLTEWVTLTVFCILWIHENDQEHTHKQGRSPGPQEGRRINRYFSWREIKLEWQYGRGQLNESIANPNCETCAQAKPEIEWSVPKLKSQPSTSGHWWLCSEIYEQITLKHHFVNMLCYYWCRWCIAVVYCFTLQLTITKDIIITAICII